MNIDINASRQEESYFVDHDIAQTYCTPNFLLGTATIMQLARNLRELNATLLSQKQKEEDNDPD